MFDTKALIFGLLCYGYGFYRVAEKLRYYKELQEDIYTETVDFEEKF